TFFNFTHTAFGPAVKSSCGDPAHLAASVQLAYFLGMLPSRGVPPRREFLMRNPPHAPPLTSGPHPCPSAVARHGPASRPPMEARAVHPLRRAWRRRMIRRTWSRAATSAARTRRPLALTP